MYHKLYTAIRRYLEDAREFYDQGGPQPVPKTMTPTAVAVFTADSDTPGNGRHGA